MTERKGAKGPGRRTGWGGMERGRVVFDVRGSILGKHTWGAILFAAANLVKGWVLLKGGRRCGVRVP